MLGSQGVAGEALIHVLLSGSDTLYWVGDRVKCFEVEGGCSQPAHSLVTLLPSPLRFMFFLFMCKVYSNLQIPNYSEISLGRNNPDIKVHCEGSGRLEQTPTCE